MATKRRHRATGEPVGRPRGSTKPLLSGRKAKAGGDPFQKDVAATRFMAAVLEHVPYSLFIDLEPALMVEEYLTLRNLAMIDRFYGWTDETIKTKLGYEPERLAMLRAHVHYGAIREKLVEVALELSKPASMMTWAKRVEDRAAMETFLVAVSDHKNHKDRLAALSSFLDRTSAKMGREGEGGGMSWPADLIQSMRFALEMQAKTATDPALIGNGGGPGADVLNVPRPQRVITGPPDDLKH